MLTLKIYDQNKYGSLADAEQAKAVYETSVDDDVGYDSMFFRDTLCSVTNAIDAAAACANENQKLEALLVCPDGEIRTLGEALDHSYLSSLCEYPVAIASGNIKVRAESSDAAHKLIKDLLTNHPQIGDESWLMIAPEKQ